MWLLNKKKTGVEINRHPVFIILGDIFLFAFAMRNRNNFLTSAMLKPFGLALHSVRRYFTSSKSTSWTSWSLPLLAPQSFYSSWLKMYNS